MSSSIADEITRLSGCRNDILSAISSKGVTVPADSVLSSCPALIDSIQTGGGSPVLYNTACTGYITATASSLMAVTQIPISANELSAVTPTATAELTSGTTRMLRYYYDTSIRRFGALTGSFNPHTTTGTAIIYLSIVPVDTADASRYRSARVVSARASAGVLNGTAALNGGTVSDINEYMGNVDSSYCIATEFVVRGIASTASYTIGETSCSSTASAYVTTSTSLPYPSRPSSEELPLYVTSTAMEYISGTATGSAGGASGYTGYKIFGEYNVTAVGRTVYNVNSTLISSLCAGFAFNECIDTAENFSTGEYRMNPFIAYYPVTAYTFSGTTSTSDVTITYSAGN